MNPKLLWYQFDVNVHPKANTRNNTTTMVLEPFLMLKLESFGYTLCVAPKPLTIVGQAQRTYPLPKLNPLYGSQTPDGLRQVQETKWEQLNLNKRIKLV